jgi:hypothetical protein
MLLEAFSSVQYFELFISETNFPDWADAVKMLLATSFLTLTFDTTLLVPQFSAQLRNVEMEEIKIERTTRRITDASS